MRLCFIKIHTYSSFNLLFSFSSSYRFLSFTEWHWTVKSVYLKMNYDVKLPVCWPQISSSMCVVKLVVQLFRFWWWVYKHNLCRLESVSWFQSKVCVWLLLWSQLIIHHAFTVETQNYGFVDLLWRHVFASSTGMCWVWCHQKTGAQHFTGRFRQTFIQD